MRNSQLQTGGFFPRRPFAERHRTRTPGFTLIEVMMVLLILAVLIGMVVGLARHMRESAQRAQATSELGELHHALAGYYARFDAYPNAPSPAAITEAWLEPLPGAPEEADATETNRWKLLYYLPDGFTGLDPWGSPYWYQHDPATAPLSYRLYSLGPNTNDTHARIFFQP